jgi:hypothetical protein
MNLKLKECVKLTGLAGLSVDFVGADMLLRLFPISLALLGESGRLREMSWVCCGYKFLKPVYP